MELEPEDWQRMPAEISKRQNHALGDASDDRQVQVQAIDRQVQRRTHAYGNCTVS